MRFMDLDSDRILSVPDLFREWKEFLTEDPWNHSFTFKGELLNIIMATVNGRNNLEIIGMTVKETESIIMRLMEKNGIINVK